jgi:hypothetical protein
MPRPGPRLLLVERLDPERFPRRGEIALCLLLAALLPGMWVPRILSVADGHLVGNLQGHTTLVVDAMDLGLLVPLALVAAWLVHRRHPVAYLLAPVLVVKAVAMGAAISAMVLAAWFVEGALEVGPLALFLAITASSAGIGMAVSRSIGAAAPVTDDRDGGMRGPSHPPSIHA